MQLSSAIHVSYCSISMRNFRLALCQFSAGSDKAFNLHTAERMIQQAAAAGGQVIVLPECFNSPYATSSFPEYAEEMPEVGFQGSHPSPSVNLLLTLARSLNVDIVGGSMPERAGGQVFNTCLCVNKGGVLAAKHRKVHLFDIDIPGKIRFKESETLSPGSTKTKFVTEYTTIGVGICYDVRFAEYAQALAADSSVGLLVYPGNFNMTTGPKHWELLLRARALDNQLFCAGCSQARDETAGYVSFANSTLVNPWGAVQAQLGAGEDMLIQNLDFTQLQDIRSGIPIRSQRRPSVYS